MKVRKLFQLCFFLFLLLPPAFALARGLSFTIYPSSAQNESDLLYAVKSFESGGTYYFLLPSGWDSSETRMEFEGADTLTLEDREIHSGDTVKLEAGENYTLQNGKKQVKICVMQGQNIPSVHITLEGNGLSHIEKSKDNMASGEILILDNNGNEVTRQKLEKMKCRGNASFGFDKKNYTIRLSDKTELFGMEKNRTWILTGNYRDKSHLRNRITLDMALYAGDQATPQSVFCDLYVDGEYRGLYLLSEKVQINKGRIDIEDLEKATEELNGGDLSNAKMAGSKAAKKLKGKYYAIENDPEDISGGYLMEIRVNQSHYTEATSAYFTRKKMTVDFHSPEYLSENQYNYISALIQSFEDAIFAEDGIDTASGKHYSELCDMDSLVFKYLIEEISKNYDGNRSSQYFYKDIDSVSEKLYAGPAWDYDSAYASYGKKDSLLSPEGFYINNQSGNYWWPALYKHEDFQEAVKEMWKEKFLPALNILLGFEKDPDGQLLSLREYEQLITASAQMNLIRWPRKTSGNTGITLSENVDFLENYITARRNWLITQWGE